MDIFICFVLFLSSLFAAMLLDLPLPLALLFGYLCFAAATLRRGFSWAALARMSLRGMASSFIVLKVFFCIGILTALWRIGGTLPLLVYEGLRLLRPEWFVLFAFLLSAAVSFLIGSSFGTAGTMGVGLIILAKAGGGNLPLIAGAILSGIYYGDRASFASSCASLMAALTGTRLYDNVPAMLKSAAPACLFSTLLYGILAPAFPLPQLDTSLLADIQALFQLSPWEYLPALLILILPLFKVGIKTAMLVSSLAAACCALLLQKASLGLILKTALLGFVPAAGNTFSAAISGGGILSMLNVTLIVLISSAYSGIFKETHMLQSVEALLFKLLARIGQFPTVLVTSVVTCAAASNQTLALILVHQLSTPVWDACHTPPEQRALHLADAVATVAPLIPWNIACAMPLSMLDVSPEVLPFAFLLYFIPLSGLFIHRAR